MVKYALEGDIENAKKMHFELLPLFRAMFLETNPIPIKSALAMKGLIEENYRLPMCRMRTETRNELKQVLEKMKII